MFAKNDSLTNLQYQMFDSIEFELANRNGRNVILIKLINSSLKKMCFFITAINIADGNDANEPLFLKYTTLLAVSKIAKWKNDRLLGGFQKYCILYL